MSKTSTSTKPTRKTTRVRVGTANNVGATTSKPGEYVVMNAGATRGVLVATDGEDVRVEVYSRAKGNTSITISKEHWRELAEVIAEVIEETEIEKELAATGAGVA